MSELFVYDDCNVSTWTIKTPRYECEKHGIINNASPYNTLVYGDKMICSKCYEEMILNQCKILKVVD